MDEVEPWGHYQPRGTAALAFAALRHRLVRGPLKKPLYRYIQAKCKAQDVLFEGLKLRCHIADNGAERAVIFQERRSAWDALRMSTDFLQPGDTFVDVGANFGLFSAVAAQKVGARGRVLSIEPHPEVLQRLKFNMAANDFEHVDVVGTAVGDQSGSAMLHESAGGFSEASLVAAPGDKGRAVAVTVTPLLQIVEAAGLARIDGLKIDVEGYEDKALLPFFDAAPRSLWPRRVVMETLHVEDWGTDCVARLLQYGYRRERETKSDVLLALE